MNAKYDKLYKILEDGFTEAETIVTKGIGSEVDINATPFRETIALAKINHAFRGAALTLIAYKLAFPEQDIRAHKDLLQDGFSARTYDNKVTIPFLIERSLPRSVESHWLTQTLSFAGRLDTGTDLKTQPKNAGPLLIEAVNYAQGAPRETLQNMLVVLLVELIKIRNLNNVTLTRPKNLSIEAVKNLISKHFSQGYTKNSPRLPQLAIFGIYKTIIGQMARFHGLQLEPIQRMKSADRKKGTVGDVVLIDNAKNPVEAVEIKYDQPVSIGHVAEAIEKVKSATVSRYYILSTAGTLEDDIEVINKKQLEFLKQNGCEIIVNGVIETIGYYLRLVPNTFEFINNYAHLVETDEDTAYEHRIAWNNLCSQL